VTGNAKSRRLRSGNNKACIYIVFVETPEGNNHFGKFGLRRPKISQQILNKEGGSLIAEFVYSRTLANGGHS
jgi:hypothetical protein